MRYRLRTLLIVLAVGPPVLAGGWLVARPAISQFLGAHEPDKAGDCEGPGVVREFSTNCDFGESRTASSLP